MLPFIHIFYSVSSPVDQCVAIWLASLHHLSSDSHCSLLSVVVPAFVSGGIWACAQIGWFVASDNLSMVVSFPIITTLPAIIGTANHNAPSSVASASSCTVPQSKTVDGSIRAGNLWGYFAFDELATDTKNVTTLLLGESSRPYNFFVR